MIVDHLALCGGACGRMGDFEGPTSQHIWQSPYEPALWPSHGGIVPEKPGLLCLFPPLLPDPVWPTHHLRTQASPCNHPQYLKPGTRSGWSRKLPIPPKQLEAKGTAVEYKFVVPHKNVPVGLLLPFMCKRKVEVNKIK